MRRMRLVSTATVSFVVLSLVGCTSAVQQPSALDPTLAPSAARATPQDTPTPTPRPTLPATEESPPVVSPEPAPTESLTEPFDYGAFGASTTVDNRWFPLVPGTQWVFQGKANDGNKRVSRKVVITVTDLVKVIDGVRSVVTYDLDYTAGELGESELAFYAQDGGGTVWLMGEYPEEIEDGKVVEAPAWIAGRQDAKAGILMKAEPEPYAPSYSEGWGPAAGWTDRAKVFEMGSATCVPAGCYKDVLVIDEFNRDEPDTHQLKYYAPGVGGVRVGWAGAHEDEQEVLELIRVVKLSPEAMAKAHAAALAQDQRSYRISPDVFAGTPPLEPGP
jgi:hypothetical protein